jgi:hypothetical protein
MEEWRYSSTILDLGTSWNEWSASRSGCKWKNYHITIFPGQSLSPKTEKLSLEETMDLSRDRLILELEPIG